MLKCRISKLGMRDGNIMKEDEEILKSIAEIVVRHQKIIQDIVEFEELFSTVNMLQFLQGAFVLSIILLDVTVVSVR